MTVLEEIRPRAEHLTEEHSRAMLHSVLTSPAPRRRSRWNRVAAVGVFGVVVAGGAAYAGGLVPDIVGDRFQQIRGGADGWPDPITGERLIADVELSNGRHARVWHADTTGGQCEIRDMTGSVERPEDFGVGCALWGYGSAEADPRRGAHWQTSVAGPAVVYGEFDGVTADVAVVRVSGPGWTKSLTVEDGAFAAEVPRGKQGDPIRFIYLDPRGEQIASKVTTVEIVSE